MRLQGKIKLGFYPLPVAEARRFASFLKFPPRFSALDACVGDDVAFCALLGDANARRYWIEIDAYRAEQARALGIETVQASTMEVRCSAESLSLIYLNPPCDIGMTPNMPL